jgi:hypothetical protein
MKTRTLLPLLTVLAPLLSVGPLLAQGPAFTYQGRLADNGSPANGTYDFTFSAWNAVTGPSQAGSALTNASTAVSNGHCHPGLRCGCVHGLGSLAGNRRRVHHVASAGSTPQLHLGQHDSANAFTRMRLSVGNTNLWDLAAGGNNNVLNFYYIPAGNDRMTLDTNGNLFIDGTLNPPSDRNVKQDFAAVDVLAVLEKVAALPIQSWAYKSSPETRHIGPVAQDFHAAFGFGTSDTSIATVDADGVTLAAIQGLNHRLEAKQSGIGGQKPEAGRPARAEGHRDCRIAPGHRRPQGTASRQQPQAHGGCPMKIPKLEARRVGWEPAGRRHARITPAIVFPPDESTTWLNHFPYRLRQPPGPCSRLAQAASR